MDPKNRPALALGALLLIALFVSTRPHSRGGSRPAGAQSKSTVVRVSGADPRSPANGELAIRATMLKSDGPVPLNGAEVWVDGKRRAVAPVTLVLPRGAHTIRLRRAGMDSPVRMVEVTHGDVQAVNFEFGTGEDPPRLSVLNHRAPDLLDRVVTVTAFMDRIPNEDLRGMWLAIREGDEWRRIPMSLLPAPGGSVGVAVLPAGQFRQSYGVSFYLVAIHNVTGENYYTEIQSSDAP